MPCNLSWSPIYARAPSEGTVRELEQFQKKCDAIRSTYALTSFMCLNFTPGTMSFSRRRCGNRRWLNGIPTKCLGLLRLQLFHISFWNLFGQTCSRHFPYSTDHVKSGGKRGPGDFDNDGNDDPSPELLRRMLPANLETNVGRFC